MLRVERILFTTDFSDASNKVLPHALEMSRKFDAEIVLGHIRTLLIDVTSGEESTEFFDEGTYAQFVEKLLKCASAEVGDRKVRAVEKSNVSAASGILELVKSEGIDLIVMSTHGRTGLGHFVLGSVAEKVVRYSEIPVLTVVPKKEGYRDNPQYRKILVGFDFSEFARNAVSNAFEMAQRYDAKLEVLNVVEQSVSSGYYETWKKSALEEVPRNLKEIEKSLTPLLGKSGMDQVEINIEIGDGDGRVANEITSYARNHDHDLLVVGTHGLAGFEHLLLGSTAERVIRSAPCPVLTFSGEKE